MKHNLADNTIVKKFKFKFTQRHQSSKIRSMKEHRRPACHRPIRRRFQITFAFADSEIQQSAIVSAVSRLLQGISQSINISTKILDCALSAPEKKTTAQLRLLQKSRCHVVLLKTILTVIQEQLAILLNDVELFNFQFVTALLAPMLCALF